MEEAQRKQKKDFDCRNRVWLNNIAVPKDLSRKFHQQWTEPYQVLSRLGSTNYHIEPVSGNGKTKVVYRNHLKPATCRPRGVDDVFVDWPEGKPSPTYSG